MSCVLVRLRAKVVPTDNGCWQWLGALDPTGYGRIALGDTMAYTHRVAAEAFYGPIPEGMTVDHLCRNRGCCNPLHLEVVTARENLMRGDTLTAAHHAGVDCGFERCRACRRHRHPAAQRAEADANKKAS